MDSWTAAINAVMQLANTTATAGGTTTLNVASYMTQVFTGSANQTVVLPTTSVTGGQIWNIVNNSTGSVTVQSSNGNTVLILGAGTKAVFTALQNVPTTSAHWHAQYLGTLVASGKVFHVNNSLTLAGADGKTLTVDNTLELAGTDGTKMTFPNATDTVATQNALQTLSNTTLGLLRISTALSSASTLTLTTSDSIYVYTGSATATWTLPTVSGNTGMVLFLYNRGSATVTVQRAGSDNLYDSSYGSVTSVLMAAGASLMLYCDATYWLVVVGAGVGKYTTTIGNGSSTSIAVTHNLGTTNITWSLCLASAPATGQSYFVDADITAISSNSVTFGFQTAPASNAINVTILG